MRKFGFRWWYILVLLVVLICAGFIIWSLTPLGPMPEALGALESSAQVAVSTERWYVFSPVAQQVEKGLIIYPGGRVDPRSYAPVANAIAESGYQVVIVPMPLNLAVFGVSKAADVIAAYPQVESWAIGGHSLGGSMAASFSNENPDLVDGLVLWASYPAGGDDLSASSLTVTSISASLDGLATPEEIEASRPLLPFDTSWIVIEGGNHAQFGWYGPQPGDLQAKISREDQQAHIVQATVDLLAGQMD